MSRLLSRVVGPVGVLVVLSVALAPLLSQPSARVNADPLHLAGDRLSSTVLLLLAGIVAGTVLWLPIAVIATLERRMARLVSVPGAVVAQALAPFVTGLALLLGLGVRTRLFPLSGSGTLAHLVLPSLALAGVLGGLLCHATYLRTVRRDTAEAAGQAAGDAPWPLDVADSWLDTISRYAGTLVGAAIVVELVFGQPGVGRLLVEAVFTRDQPVMAAALVRLVTISTVVTALFGVGAAITSWRLDLTQRKDARSQPTAADTVESVTHWSVERRWPAVSVLVLGAALLAGLLALTAGAGADPMRQNIADRLAGPGVNGHLLGTDPIGRDVAARIAHSLLTPLWLVAGATFAAAFVGVTLGAIGAAFRIGDVLVSLLVDSAQVVPAIAFGLVAASILGPGVVTLGVVVSVVMTFALTRLTRDAAGAAWAGGRRQLRPALGAVALALLVGMSTALVLVATLDFLGVGTLPPTPSLGGMMSDGRAYLTTAPWLLEYPALTLTTLVASLLLMGYGAFGLLRPSVPPRHEAVAEPVAPAIA